MNEVAAILLAAGRSRRMGAFKPLLPFGKQTVIRSCIAQLRAAGIEEIVVVAGHRADELRADLLTENVTFAINPDPDSEMSVSIACGIEALSEHAKAILIALVDHPAIPSKTIMAIVDKWNRGTRLVQPEHNGRGGHPVLIDLGYRDDLLDLDPQRGLRGFFESHRGVTHRLPVDSPYIARDMDTWEDYLALHQEVFGAAPAGK